MKPNILSLLTALLLCRCKSQAILAMACCGFAVGALGHSGGNTVILDTSFESNQTLPPAPQHQVVSDKARTGSRSLFGQVSEPKKACFLRVPFQAKAGMELLVSFQACGDKGPGATIFIRVGEKRTRLASVDLKPEWQEVRAAHTFAKDSEGTVEIIAPSSYGGKPGRAWVDDVLINVRQPIFARW